MRPALRGCFVLACLLSGCTGLQAPQPAPDWDARRLQLLEVDAWELRGRVAIKAASGGGNASLDWLQQGSLSRLRLAGPFGASGVEFAVAPERITFSDRTGEVALAYAGPQAAERFLDEQLGWSFPVHSARYWVLGLLDPDYNGDRLFDADGELRSLQQHGWTVVYDRFATRNGYYLPAKLEIENPRLRLRMVISDWSPLSGLTP